jgi:hypothetical protein
VRVRIIKEPVGSINGIALRQYRPSLVYDLPPTLANYLVISGFAIFEMRGDDQQALPAGVDRRRAPGLNRT